MGVKAALCVSGLEFYFEEYGKNCNGRVFDTSIVLSKNFIDNVLVCDL